MKEKINKIINRGDETEDWTFVEFLKKYWWIEFLVLAKIIIFVQRESYEYSTGILILLGTFLVLWVLYKAGLD
jgi:hypothetical protein